MGAIAAAAILDQEAIKEQKRIKLQLYSKQCSIVRDYHGKRINLNREKELRENFNFCFLFFTSISHSYDIKPCYIFKKIIRFDYLLSIFS